MISTEIKTTLNQRLHEEVMGLTGTPPDYAKDMNPILAELAKDGWSVQGWTSEERTTAAPWETAKVISIRRRMMLLKTNKHTGKKYEGAHTTEFFEVVGNLCTAFEPKEILDTPATAFTLTALAAKTKGPRPLNWLKDL